MLAIPVEPTPPVPEDEVVLTPAVSPPAPPPVVVVEVDEEGPDPSVVLNCKVPVKFVPRTTAENVPSFGK